MSYDIISVICFSIRVFPCLFTVLLKWNKKWMKVRLVKMYQEHRCWDQCSQYTLHNTLFQCLSLWWLWWLVDRTPPLKVWPMTLWLTSLLSSIKIGLMCAFWWVQLKTHFCCVLVQQLWQPNSSNSVTAFMDILNKWI